jgi:pimeloyl-ACP methyl ester carboxylesterase
MILEIDGTRLSYETAGDGEPLLWLHGFMGRGSDWQYIFPAPPAGFRLIAPDLRGHGASDNPSGEFSFRRCARDVRALLEHLNVRRVKAIGLSGGGITLLHMATSEPACVTGMVLVSAPPYFPEQTRAFQREFSEAALPESERAQLRTRHVQGEPQVQRLFALARAMADDYEDASFTPPRLATITARTLVVFGDRDPLYPVSLAMELRAAIPRSYLWVVPNGGHGPVFGDAARAFATTALSFLRGEWETD